MANWCNRYGCWCDKVLDLYYGIFNCDKECDDCEDMEIVNTINESEE